MYVARNRVLGMHWGFRIICQKNSKYSKSASHNWKSSNYDDLMNKSALVEQASPGEAATEASPEAALEAAPEASPEVAPEAASEAASEAAREEAPEDEQVQRKKR